MNIKRKELLVFSLVSLLSLGTITVAIGASNGGLANGSLSNVEAGPAMSCKLDWTNTEKINNGLCLSKNGAVELKYGSAVTQDSESHAILYGNDIENNYIATSGRPYENGVGGFANGIYTIEIDFDDQVADLEIYAWNTFGPKPDKKFHYTIRQSGVNEIPDNSTFGRRANSFSITRKERVGGDPTVPLKIRSIKVTCSALEEPIVTKNVTAGDFETLKYEMSGVDTYEDKVITLTNDIEFKVSNTTARGLQPEILIHDKDIKLDLNGHTLSFAQDVQEFACVPAFFGLRESAYITILDSTADPITGIGKGSLQAHIGEKSVYGIYVGKRGIAREYQPTLTIESGTFIGAPTAIQVATGYLHIENGYFDVPQFVKDKEPDKTKYIINCIDDLFTSGNARVKIDWGTYGYDYSLPVEQNEGKYEFNSVNNMFYKNADGTFTVIEIASLNKAFEKELNSTSNYVLKNDIKFKFSKTIKGFDIKTVIDNPDLTIDLNGHKLDFKPLTKDNNATTVLFDLVHNSNVRIIDSSKNKTGSIDVSAGPNFIASAMVFRLSDTSKLTIEDGIYTGAMQVAQVDGGTLTINGGEFNLTDKYKETDPKQAMYIINGLDASIASGAANIVINGGTFGYDYSKSTETNYNYMAEGKISVDNEDGTWTILNEKELLTMTMADGSTKLTSTKHLEHLLNNTNEYKLEGDIEFALNSNSDRIRLEPQIFIKNPNLNIDLAGHAIKFATKAEPDTIMKGVICFFQITDNSHVIFSDSSVEKTGIVDTNITNVKNNEGAYAFNVNGENAKLTINSGNYTGGPTAVQVRIGLLEVYGGNFDIDDGCKVIAPEYTKYVINCIDASFKSGIANIKLYGGTFCFDPSSKPESLKDSTYVAEGYESVKNEDNTYSIHKIEVAQPETTK